MWALLIALIGVAGLLGWRFWALSRLMNRLEAELATLASARVLEGPDIEALLAPERPTLIAIEILNPFELAMRESRLAGPFGSLAPAMLRQEVYRQATERVREQLAAQGVQAEVTLVRGR